ncbi:MAG: PAS domain S-box protein [Gammaproteobacteria bacterium]|nr:PAS domain S-box protein [Gammaproteobacteria bacterium]
MSWPITSNGYALRAAAIYAGFAAAWILSSDHLLRALAGDAEDFARYQTYKGWGFVAITSLLLYALLRRSPTQDAAPMGAAPVAHGGLRRALALAAALVVLVITVNLALVVRQGRHHAAAATVERAGDLAGAIAARLGAGVTGITARLWELEGAGEGRTLTAALATLPAVYGLAFVDAAGVLHTAGAACDASAVSAAPVPMLEQTAGGGARLVIPARAHGEGRYVACLAPAFFAAAASGAGEDADVTVLGSDERRVWSAGAALPAVAGEGAWARGDRAERYLARRAFGGLPASVVVGVAREHALAQWRREAQQYGLVAAVFIVALVWLARLMLAAIRRRDEFELALAASEERFAQAFHHNPLPTLLSAAASGRILALNDQAAALFGAPADELIGRTVPELGLWADPAERSLAFAEIATHGRVRGFVARLKRRDGVERIVQVAAASVEHGAGREPALVTTLDDVTEKLRAEREAAVMTERFTLLARATTDVVWDHDVATGSVWWNENLATLLGCPGADVGGDPGYRRSLLHPEDRDRVWESFRAAVAGTASMWSGEYRCRRADGTYAYVLDRACLIRDAEGRCVRMIGAMTDLTPRRVAETALADSEARFRKLFESNPIPMWVYDVDTLRFLAVNDAAVAHYGYAREDFLAMTLRDLRPADEAGRLERAVAELGDEPSRAGVWRHRRQDGTLIDVEVASDGIGFGAHRARIMIANDVTQRLRAERELKASEARYRELVDTAEEGIVAVDVEARITFVNPRMARMLGLPPEALAGRPLTAFMDEAAAALALGRSTVRRRAAEAYRFLPLSGAELWGLVSTAPLPDEAGGLTGTLCLVTDVSARRQAEQEIRRLNAELERRVAERTEQLANANHELEAFTYSVSHDLRAPLRHIDGFARLLLETELPPGSPQERYLRIIAGSAVKLGRLIDGLLALSRAGRAPLAHGRVALDSLLAELREESLRDAAGRDIAWSIGPLGSVDGDPVLLRQVFANLLDNAVKFTAATHAAHIDIRAARPDGECVVTVRDNGVGFDMRYVDRLFGVFQRLHREDEFPGTGIGLATVQRIVHRHGGRVSAEATPGGGACFTVVLPVAGDCA